MLPRAHLDNLGAVAQRTFLDKCLFINRTEGAGNDYGYPSETYTDEAAHIDCGFAYLTQDEATDISAEAPLADAMLRLALNEDITNLDRVKITHLKGAELSSPLVFDVIGSPTPYGTELALLLKLTSEL